MNSNKYFAREVDRQEWNFYWAKIKDSNLLQAWEYGEAKKTSQSWMPFRYVIENINGEAIAITQILTKTLPIIGGIARLNRGPLLLSKTKNQSPTIYLDLLRSVIELRKINKWWLFFIAPEIRKGQLNDLDLMNLGFKLRKSNPWGSSRLDLSINQEDLIKNLKGKWRNLLRKAQKSDIKVQKICANGPEFERLLSFYLGMQKEKNFTGMPLSLLRELGKVKGKMWHFTIYLGKLDCAEGINPEKIGMLISAQHGNTATYLIGYTGSVGRKFNINYLLLFQAILDAKASGCESFDLGGLNSSTPKGIVHFKRGVSGQDYELLGEYVLGLF